MSTEGPDRSTTSSLVLISPDRMQRFLKPASAAIVFTTAHLIRSVTQARRSSAMGKGALDGRGRDDLSFSKLDITFIASNGACRRRPLIDGGPGHPERRRRSVPKPGAGRCHGTRLLEVSRTAFPQTIRVR
jgi:hypothetical protein